MGTPSAPPSEVVARAFDPFLTTKSLGMGAGDDEPTPRMLISDTLAELGYRAIEAGDGASGLKILESDVRIDLVITDVGLPGGMNGRQMVDAARLSRSNLKVLFITSYAENAAIGNGYLEPGMHVLTKPFAMEKLAARVKAIVAAD